MKNKLHLLCAAAVVLISTTAIAQPLPPYFVEVQGILQNCSMLSSITVTSDQSNGQVTEELDIDYIENTGCYFWDSLDLMDFQGDLVFSYPCEGAILEVNASYEVGLNGIATVTVFLPCGPPAEDCLGIENGLAWPNMPCDDGDPQTLNDYWSADCTCTGTPIPVDCYAGFWALQGYTYEYEDDGDPNTQDSTVIPIPNEIWVWNLSYSMTGNMTFLWTFGDGTSSTEAYPTHVYGGTGPYELCLYITDEGGCTDSYCETIAVDENGMYNGLVAGDGSRTTLTLNVVQQQPLSVNQPETTSEIELWPNPVNDMLSMSISGTLRGQISIEIIDLNGKQIQVSGEVLSGGENNLQMDVSKLQPGMYMLRIGNGSQATCRRFVKQ